jgi:hypothetical protein
VCRSSCGVNPARPTAVAAASNQSRRMLRTRSTSPRVALAPGSTGCRDARPVGRPTRSTRGVDAHEQHCDLLAARHHDRIDREFRSDRRPIAPCNPVIATSDERRHEAPRRSPRLDGWRHGATPGLAPSAGPKKFGHTTAPRCELPLNTLWAYMSHGRSG